VANALVQIMPATAVVCALQPIAQGTTDA